ncbi:MAG: hypothetical protein ABJQ34_18690 [Paracoccaceae bacterium]
MELEAGSVAKFDDALVNVHQSALGIDIRMVQAQLGRTNLKTTEVYLCEVSRNLRHGDVLSAHRFVSSGRFNNGGTFQRRVRVDTPA